VAASFADIFFSNCTKIGCCRSCCRRRGARADGGGRGEVDLEALEVRFDGRAVPFELDDETAATACSTGSTTSRSRCSRETRSTRSSANRERSGR
jgi:3-isopropylmalate dehydratase small subunit